MHNPFSIEGKTILVTGASSGIGKATAEMCALMGANVITIGRREVCDYAVDLADASTWKELLDNMPVVDGIAACAGIANMNPYTFITAEEVDKVFKVNCFGPILLVKEIIKRKKLNKGASVVFVSSVDGPKVVHAGNTIYSGSKSALVGMARNMAIDLASKKIRVNCVLPGTTDTPMIRTANVTEEMLQETAKSFPLKRFATPQDIANGIVYLLSDASAFVTGTELTIDGGYSIL